jgi:diketogulonate reductase-like aldo/keto reductase
MSPASRRDFLRTLAVAGCAPALLRWLPAHAEDAAMITRTIPVSGEALPVVGLGTWQAFDIRGDADARRDATQTLREFLAAGLRVIDSSPMYGAAEAVVGELLEPLDTKQSAFIATKVWVSGAEAGRRQIENSYRLLRRKTLDLILVHNLLDLDAHLPTLAQFKREKRLRYVGVTHYTASAHAALVRAIERGGIDFVQVNYALSEREAEKTVLPAAAANKVAVLINRPLGEGAVLARVRGKPLPPIAADVGATTWAQLALKWIIGHPAVTCVIPGTRNPRHLLDNAAAGRGIVPDAALRARIAEAFDSA